MTATKVRTGLELQFATFYVDELLLALPIEHVQEINRNLEITPIPQAPSHVRGVMNLRGDVATVIDMRRVLGFAPAEVTPLSRNLIVRTADVSIGLWIDQISDIITIEADTITPPPANVSGVDGRYFRGVHRTETDLVVIVDVDQVLSHE